MCTIRAAETGDDYAALGALVRQYVSALPFELDFQDIEAELAALEQEYGPPGGAALLVERAGVAVGCAGIHPFEPPAVAELKRMFLLPVVRGRGLGRLLAEAAIERARELGYRSLRLDTVEELEAARAVYASLGFVEIAAYRHNPLPSARFYELSLGETGSR